MNKYLDLIGFDKYHRAIQKRIDLKNIFIKYWENKTPEEIIEYYEGEVQAGDYFYNPNNKELYEFCYELEGSLRIIYKKIDPIPGDSLYIRLIDDLIFRWDGEDMLWVRNIPDYIEFSHNKQYEDDRTVLTNQLFKLGYGEDSIKIRKGSCSPDLSMTDRFKIGINLYKPSNHRGSLPEGKEHTEVKISPEEISLLREYVPSPNSYQYHPKEIRSKLYLGGNGPVLEGPKTWVKSHSFVFRDPRLDSSYLEILQGHSTLHSPAQIEISTDKSYINLYPSINLETRDLYTEAAYTEIGTNTFYLLNPEGERAIRINILTEGTKFNSLNTEISSERTYFTGNVFETSLNRTYFNSGNLLEVSVTKTYIDNKDIFEVSADTQYFQARGLYEVSAYKTYFQNEGTFEVSTDHTYFKSGNMFEVSCDNIYATPRNLLEISSRRVYLGIKEDVEWHSQLTLLNAREGMLLRSPNLVIEGSTRRQYKYKYPEDNTLVIKNFKKVKVESSLEVSYIDNDSGDLIVKSEGEKVPLLGALKETKEITSIALNDLNDKITKEHELIIKGQRVAAAALVNLDERVINLDNLKVEQTILTTYADLVTLRNTNKLRPGLLYRITDYTATTGQTNTLSANHKFDIIVRADSENKLNENAKAVLNTTDHYFDNSNLAAWELKYCLDNDLNKFAWAVSNGKGVVYYMKDEFNNECPYDFKNILFARLLVTTDNPYLEFFDNKYFGILEALDHGKLLLFEELTGGNTIYMYTFHASDSQNNLELDATVSIYNNEKPDEQYEIDKCRNNIISPVYSFYITDNNCYLGTLVLPDIVFMNTHNQTNGVYITCENNVIGINSYYNTFNNNCSNNTIGSYCLFNSFGHKVTNNIVGDRFQSNYVSENFKQNIIGNECTGNVFDSNCLSNIINHYILSNTFGEGFEYNIINSYNAENIYEGHFSYNIVGSYFELNQFGEGCQGNTFGNQCSLNTFGDNCVFNTFSNGCTNITLDNDCLSNIFEKNVTITLGEQSDHNYFGPGCISVTLGQRCKNNSFGNNCQRITFSTIGNDEDNTFGNHCCDITLDLENKSNTFGNSVNNITLEYPAKFLIIEEGNEHILLTSSASTGSYLLNIKITQGVNNSSTTKTITHPTLDDTFLTIYLNPNSTVVIV